MARDFIELNGNLIFSAADQIVGVELYRTDGTPNGTFLLKDISPGFTHSFPSKFVKWKNKIYFTASSPTSGNLWVTDGTTTGTNSLLGSGSGNPIVTKLFTNDSDYLYFIGSANSTSNLYRTDGVTTAPSAIFDNVENVTFCNNQIFFTTPQGIWKTDGTQQNTISVKTIPLTDWRRELVALGSKVFFLVTNNSNSDLWQTDGTFEGTVKLRTFKSVGLQQGLYAKVNNWLYFLAGDDATGVELWRANESGTIELVKDLTPTNTTYSYDLRYSGLMIDFNGKILFRGNNGSGQELWLSDGTSSGTKLLKEIYPGAGNSQPNSFYQYNGAVYFNAYDGNNWSLWKTNGEECGTVRVTENTTVDIIPGSKFGRLGSKLYLSGNDYFYGVEPYVHDTDLDKAIPIECKTNQQILFSLEDVSIGVGSFILSGYASTRLPVSYQSSDPSVISINGTVATVNAIGTVTITATQPGNTNVKSAVPVAQTVSVLKGSQLILFPAISAKAYGEGDFLLSATSSSGLPISFVSSDNNKLSIQGNQAKILAAGTVQITAYQLGNSNFYPASPVSQTLTISKGQQTITFLEISSKTYGDVPFSLNVEASSGLPVAFEISRSSIIEIDNKIVKILNAGEVLITAMQEGNENYLSATSIQRQLVIDKKSQIIFFPAIVSKTIGDPGFLISASASSGLETQFVSLSSNIEINSARVEMSATGTASIKANQPGNTNFYPAESVIQSFCVNPPKPSIVSVEFNGDGAILTSSASNGNQWYFNGGIILGATEQTHKAVETGIFTLTVTEAMCTSDPSEPSNVIITGLEANRSYLTLHPNPANDFMVVDAGTEIIDKITVYNILGQALIQVSTGNTVHKLNLTDLASGVYILGVQLSSNGQSLVRFYKN